MIAVLDVPELAPAYAECGSQRPDYAEYHPGGLVVTALRLDKAVRAVLMPSDSPFQGVIQTESATGNLSIPVALFWQPAGSNTSATLFSSGTASSLAPSEGTIVADVRSEAEASEHPALAEFVAYDMEDWDCEGAEPITKATRELASGVLSAIPVSFPPPDVAPSADGSICMEWNVGNAKVWVDVGPGKKVLTYYNSGAGQREARTFLGEVKELSRNSGLCRNLQQSLAALFRPGPANAAARS